MKEVLRPHEAGLFASTMEIPHCRCCDSADVNLVGSLRGQFVKRDFFYFKCGNCHFLFVHPCMGPEIYDEAYYRGEGADPHVNYALEHANYRATDRIVEFQDLQVIAERFFRKTRSEVETITWLDFGCGAGGFLKFLRDRAALKRNNFSAKIELTGYDVGTWAEMLKNLDGFNILNDREFDQLPNGIFDVISLIEVLEHVKEPAKVVQRVGALLKPGGLLLLTTANLESPVARFRKLKFRYCLSEVHISLFNPECLNFLYRSAGLVPTRVKYKGVIKFKALKSIFNPLLKKFARILLHVPGVIQLLDWAYGISAMPCATKE